MKLVARKTLWLPTWWGLFWIMLISVVLLWLFIKTIGPWLAPTQPVADKQFLVVEGWQDEESLLDAYALFQQENYQFLITTGGPDTRQINPRYPSFAEQAAAFLISQGMPARQLVVVPAPASAQNRTYLSVVMLREWLEAEGIQLRQLNVHTSHVHARRTRSLYQKAMADIEIGIYAAPPINFSLTYWWQTSDGAKSVFTEILGNIAVWCCFNPGAPGSHYEKWAVEKNQPD